MRRKMLSFIAIGIGIGLSVGAVSFLFYSLGLKQIFTFCNPFEVAVPVICTCLILYKLDEIRKE